MLIQDLVVQMARFDVLSVVDLRLHDATFSVGCKVNVLLRLANFVLLGRNGALIIFNTLSELN